MTLYVSNFANRKKKLVLSNIVVSVLLKPIFTEITLNKKFVTKIVICNSMLIATIVFESMLTALCTKHDFHVYFRSTG